MSSFILVVKEGKLTVPGDNQHCSNYGYNTRHGPFNTRAKYHCSKFGHTVVMNIWNIDAWQRQKYLTSAESCYFRSLSDRLSYLLVSIMLLLQIIATVISTVQFERNNAPFITEVILNGEFNCNIFEITIMLCNKYMYIVPIIFQRTWFFYGGAYWIHSCEFPSCYGIWSKLMITM